MNQFFFPHATRASRTHISQALRYAAARHGEAVADVARAPGAIASDDVLFDQHPTAAVPCLGNNSSLECVEQLGGGDRVHVACVLSSFKTSTSWGGGGGSARIHRSCMRMAGRTRTRTSFERDGEGAKVCLR